MKIIIFFYSKQTNFAIFTRKMFDLNLLFKIDSFICYVKRVKIKKNK